MKWLENRVHYYSYVIYGFLYLAIFSFVGVFNLAFAQWNAEVLTTAEYWISTLTTSFTYIVAFQITVQLASDVMSQNHEDFIATEKEITKFGRTNVHSDFSDFIDEINWISKRDTWKTRITNKLIDLNNKASQRVLDELKGDPLHYSTKTKRFVYLKSQYEEQLTDKWIEENLRYKKLRYPTITPSEVVTGERKPYNSVKVIDNGVGAYAFTRRIGMLAIMIVINALMDALLFSGNPFDVVAIMMILFQIFMILVNIFSGWISGIDAFKKKKLNSVYIRRDLLVAYAGWRNTKQVDITKLKEVQNETN